MNFIRASADDTALFTPEQLVGGARCFYSEDGLHRCRFDIRGCEAVLHADDPDIADAAIREFLFYSGFITRIGDANGHILWEGADVPLEMMDIRAIQPSQFFINARKLTDCAAWVRDPADIMVPVARMGGRIVSLDGHTRLRLALERGYERVYVFHEDGGAYIGHFVEEAIERGVTCVADMEIISDEDYKVRWHEYCDAYFAGLDDGG